jgi:hypothetical protein
MHIPAVQEKMFEQGAWKFMNTFAPWHSALGAISAVITSLYLARRDKNIRLDVSAGQGLLWRRVSRGNFRNIELYRWWKIGHREAQLTVVRWQVGIYKKRYAVQTTIHTDGLSGPLSTRLRDGAEARGFTPLAGEDEWLADSVHDLLAPFPRNQSRFSQNTGSYLDWAKFE